MLRSLFVLALPLSLLASEPSAFGAGNLDSQSPYGLTPSEKKILSNKEKLDQIEQQTRSHENEVESLRERLDGLQTIVEGLALRAQENKVELGKLSGSYQDDQTQKDASQQQLRTLVDANAKSIEEIKKLLGDFSGMIDAINTSYVSKEDYNALVEDINEFKDIVTKELKALGKSGKPASASPFGDMSKAQIADEAYEFYTKKLYNKAIERYEYLIQKNYKPARAHYMLGEMWHYRKEYAKAISYFKESARLYDKADYMPTLLLHTAEAMEHTGDMENARAFYGAVAAKYPNSSEAKTAKKRLQ